MLGTRVLSGLFLIAVLLGVLYLDEWLAPWFPLWFLLSVLALSAAAAELVGLLRTAGCGPSLNSVLGGVAAIVVANWIPHLAESLAERTTVSSVAEPLDAIAVLSWPLLTFVGILMVSFLVQSVQFVKPGRTMATISGTILVIAYVGLLGSFIIQMRWLEDSRHGMVPLLLLMATAKGADTGAYSMGRLMGRHKLWPSLSPNKTVEGAIGGMIFAVAWPLLVRLATRALLSTFMLGWCADSLLWSSCRPCRPARRFNGVDDQARLRTKGRLVRGPRLWGSSRRSRFAPLRRPRSLCLMHSPRPVSGRLWRLTCVL